MPDAVPDIHSDLSTTDPQAYCTAVTRAAGSNFYYAFLPLPKERRDALFVIYAFCRHADDIVDDEPDRSVAAKKLDAFRKECENALAGNATHPISRRLAEVVKAFDIDPKLPFELLDGMAMDLGPVRYETPDALCRYCYLVAGVVGLMCIKVFGCTHPDADRFAVANGEALQLTNILRDVAKDAAIGRIYLPQSDVERFGVTEDDLLSGHTANGFVKLMDHTRKRAEERYDEAARIARSLPEKDRRALFPARIMGVIYRALLSELAEREYRLEPPVSLSAPRKLWLAAGAWVNHTLSRW